MESSNPDRTEHRILENLLLSVDGGSPKLIRTIHYSYVNNRYLSLRDLASALSGTPKQFDVTVSDGVIRITANQNYTPSGGENTPFPLDANKEFFYETENLNVNPILFDGRELKYYGFLGRNSAALEDCFLNLTDLAMQMDVSLQLSEGMLVVDTSRHFIIDRRVLEEDSFYYELHSAVVGDAGTGEIYLSWEPDLSVPVASTSKLMSYAVIMDCIAEGVISSEDRVTITEEAEKLSRSGDGIIPLTAGTEIPLCELLHGMLIASSNECALALAVHAAGSEKGFIERMMRKSVDLGLSDKVRFFNCHGLPVYTDNLYTTKVQNRMTANDMFILVRHIMKNDPEITAITSRKGAFLKTLDTTVENSNPLLYNVPGVVGLKTGTTDMARNCLVTLMKAEDADGERHDLVAVQFGAEDKTVCTSVSEVLIRYARQRLLHDRRQAGHDYGKRR